MSTFRTIIFTFSTVYVVSIILKWEIKLSPIIKGNLTMVSSYLNFLGESNKTFIIFICFAVLFASETQFCNSKLVIVSAESLEYKYSAMLIFSNWFTRGVIYFSLISYCENLDQSILELDARSDTKSSVMISRELVG